MKSEKAIRSYRDDLVRIIKHACRCGDRKCRKARFIAKMGADLLTAILNDDGNFETWAEELAKHLSDNGVPK